MKYGGRKVEVLSTKATFGKTVACVRVLSTGEVFDVCFDALENDESEVSIYNLRYRAMAARIKNEIDNSPILSPYESACLPLPHQILALEKIMGGAYCRYLVADEVGMGKTIEAGLALKELKLRGIVKRVLIVVPVGAMAQWQSELKKHFNENFRIYDSNFISDTQKTFSRLDMENGVNIWWQNNQIIAPLDSLRPIEKRQGWSEEKIDAYNRHRIESVVNAEFDLLIIDECHKVGGADESVSRFKMAETLCSAIPNGLLLSATPHRGKTDHFCRILRLLDSDAFSPNEAPSLEELEPYIVRSEKRQAIDYNGKPLFKKRRTECLLAKYDAKKHARQMVLYDAVTEYVKKGFALATKTNNQSYGFVMTLFQKMMSSSTQAIFDAMKKRAARLEAEKENRIEEENIDEDENVVSAYDTELQELKYLSEMANHCLLGEVDVKLEYLLKKLDELKTAENNFDVKFIIFTEFTSTQKMLCKELFERGGYKTVAINGSMDMTERLCALREFKDSAQILVSTDAAGESLNMQFAHIVINYDLPWNPMIIEQRIGRVDRIGQDNEVLAVNMLIDNSIDSRVYDVIETKLGQILQDMGIDKTGDVLDSTLDAESVSDLYKASILDPEKFKKQSDDWLFEVKKKLSNYKATEKLLPSTKDGDINLSETQKIKHSPLPFWLREMCESYFSDKGIKTTRTLDGLLVKLNPGEYEKYYTFDSKVGLENPSAETLTLQSDLILKMISDAIAVTEADDIPILEVPYEENAAGVFMIMQITARNAYETRRKITPIFISDKNQYFAPYSQKLLSDLSMGNFDAKICGVIKGDDAKKLFFSMFLLAEKYSGAIYQELESKINERSATMKKNKEKAFNFQMRQANRIGIERIKNYRIRKYKAEYENWLENYERARRIVPKLECLLMAKIEDAKK